MSESKFDEIYVEEDERGKTEDQNNNADKLTLVPKRGGVSVVWKYFGFKTSDVDQKTIFCKLCCTKVAASGRNTSNLLSHLERKHVKLPIMHEDERVDNVKWRQPR